MHKITSITAIPPYLLSKLINSEYFEHMSLIYPDLKSDKTIEADYQYLSNLGESVYFKTNSDGNYTVWAFDNKDSAISQNVNIYLVKYEGQWKELSKATYKTSNRIMRSINKGDVCHLK